MHPPLCNLLLFDHVDDLPIQLFGKLKQQFLSIFRWKKIIHWIETLKMIFLIFKKNWDAERAICGLRIYGLQRSQPTDKKTIRIWRHATEKTIAGRERFGYRRLHRFTAIYMLRNRKNGNNDTPWGQSEAKHSNRPNRRPRNPKIESTLNSIYFIQFSEL